MGRFHIHVRRESVFFALGAMEACVVTPILAALLSSVTLAQPSLIAGAFLGAVLVVHYIARASLRLSLHPLLRSGLLGAGMLASGLLVVHQLLYAQVGLWNPVWLISALRGLQKNALSLDMVVFLLVLFAWWRGFVLAQRSLDSNTVVSCFRSGLIVLAITTTAGGVILPVPLYQFVFAFFFVSLLGIALGRAEEVERQHGGSQTPFGLGWLAIVVTASLVILLLAVGVATLLTGENVSRFIGPMLEAQRTLFLLLAYALAYVLSWIESSILEFLKGLLSGVDLEDMELALTPPDLGSQVEPVQSLFTPDQLALAKAVGIIGGMLLLLLGITLSLRQLRTRDGHRRDEERESVWEEVNLRRSLRDLLQDGRRRLGEMADTLKRSRPGKIFAARTIRRIYAHLSALAEERGYPRAFYETPLEYLPVLERAFPDNREQVEQITRAYVAVHYGQVPERPEDLKIIRTAWERICETVAANSHSHRRVPNS